MPDRKSDAEQRAAVPDAMQAASAAQDAAGEAVERAAAVSPAVEHAAARVEAAAEHLAESVKDAAEGLKTTKSARLCPRCQSELEKYAGANPHKQGTSYCAHCGVRWAAGLRETATGMPI